MSDVVRDVWCVSDGRAGIERQTLAVANALSELIPIETQVVRLTPTGPQTWLPPQFWPAPLAALPPAQRHNLASPWPDIWIANGRRSIPYSLRAKAWSGGKSLIVQVQDPRVDPALFDVVVPPGHDRLRGPNVVETVGAPVWFTGAQVQAAKQQFPELDTILGQKVLVILGGPSKRHHFSLDRAQAIVADLTALCAQNVHLLITTSRRTPEPIVALFREFAARHPASFFANEAQDGPNPYLAWLASATSALVTEDSTNMMTDAAFFGLPIHLVKLEGSDARFDLLHKGFIERGAARWFDGALESWTYAAIKDGLEVAQAILARLPT